MSDVTRILSAIEQGDPSAAEELLPLVYDELRKLAVVKLAHEKTGQTLQATALVHEAYLRLVTPSLSPSSQGGDEGVRWNSRGHFFAAAAEAMRRILIDQARRKASEKSGGKRQRVDLAAIEPVIRGPQLDLLAIDEALTQLEQADPRAATVVKLRFFAALTMPEVADALGISLATAENDWAYAKCCLRLQLADEPNHHSSSD